MSEQSQQSAFASRDRPPEHFDTLSGLVHALDERAATSDKLQPWVGLRLRARACLARLVLSSLQRLWFQGLAGVPPARIVVYTVGILGDNVVMAPAFAAIRAAYPQAHITLVNNAQIWSRAIAEGFLERLPYHDRLVCITDVDCPVQREGMRFRMVVPELEWLQSDLFVNLSPFGNRGWPGAVFREMIWARRTGATRAVGFSVAASAPVGRFAVIQHRYVQNEPTRHRAILSQLGLVPPSNWTLPSNGESAAAVSGLLDSLGVKRGAFGLIHPGAKFQSKQWPPDRFAAVAAALMEATGLHTVVTGMPEETAICEAVVASSNGAAISLAGRTGVWELIECTRMARFCVTNDTGTMHIAAAVGTPTVAIFSAYQNPQRWFPNSMAVRVFWTSTDCAMCGQERCDHIRCLTAISPDAVVAACLSLARGT